MAEQERSVYTVQNDPGAGTLVVAIPSDYGEARWTIEVQRGGTLKVSAVYVNRESGNVYADGVSVSPEDKNVILLDLR